MIKAVHVRIPEVADVVLNVGRVMLIKQRLMEGVQKFLEAFWSLLSGAGGGDEWRGRRHCFFVAIGAITDNNYQNFIVTFQVSLLLGNHSIRYLVPYVVNFFVFTSSFIWFTSCFL